MTHRQLLREAFQRHGMSESEINRKFTASAIKFPLNLDDEVKWQDGMDEETAKEQLINGLLKAFSKLDANPKLKSQVMEHCENRMRVGSRRN